MKVLRQAAHQSKIKTNGGRVVDHINMHIGVHEYVMGE